MEFIGKNNYRKTSGIYQIKSNINDKIYIGSAIDLVKRYREHLSLLKNNKHYSVYLKNHSKKYGYECFSFSVLCVCKSYDLIKNEQYFIDALNPINPNGFNARLIATSDIGVKRNPESIKKAVETKRKNGYIPFSGVDRSLYSGKNHPNYGKRHSEETKKKIGEKSIGRKNKGSRHFLGKKHTEESKMKMSIAMKDNKNNLGKKHSDGSKIKMSHAAKEREERKRINITK